jgi:gamma-glutamylcyclotransferase (GGCT)/AIG2-like uncharacterized protein YtfP
MHVFTYGTLQVEEIWTRVTGMPVKRIKGVVTGYAVRRIRGEDYPGMTPTPGGEAPGLVYLDVPAGALERLDRFEGGQYVRRSLAVRCEDGQIRQCEAYLVAGGSIGLLTNEAWLLESFITSGGLARFSSRYLGFAALEQ